MVGLDGPAQRLDRKTASLGGKAGHCGLAMHHRPRRASGLQWAGKELGGMRAADVGAQQTTIIEVGAEHTALLRLRHCMRLDAQGLA